MIGVRFEAKLQKITNPVQLWDRFANTGAVGDYLAYCQQAHTAEVQAIERHLFSERDRS